MNGYGLPVAIVHACLRDGRGGSPTAVMEEAPLTDDQRRRIPVLMGTSHAVFGHAHHGRAEDPTVSLRFFTAEGELPACGHGTLAALAFLAERSGVEDYRATLHAPGRTFAGRAVREDNRVSAVFDAGPVSLREPTAIECDLVLRALGVTSDTLAPGARVAAMGRPRLLIPVTTRSALAALVPDLARLRAACDRLGLLGCYVYSTPTHIGQAAARMFAPSIGVAEDIANANSTACLAVHLAGQGVTDLTVDMGDSLRTPSTITTTTRHGQSGPLVQLGGAAKITRIVRLP
ncbi:PhzF family phenazine biosynthesis protein [Streptosporangium roseum]|uniref:Epimerase PhzC/PhzF n=1 Tax=Streptosporangium roseum (strain ATCC 12428 / DSM 43021 / JCM 3005 / KCTC 9067 / NCIMB 10171 / NRRL 2505 / NI 9100) TaxID=479432 RepID=D2BA57_STRRD|nr:PhzF family phenazine biosynthesis isomerase [Streptosporangium roseum]ACZ87882.1 epimerase PhzC/PhzF [Streptosporangium roseum DSM 43021]